MLLEYALTLFYKFAILALSGEEIEPDTRGVVKSD
jgi:hypothetical protein